ncbi:hypothetical protein RvY_11339 [Ramazzottius varieornatus]|uniref:Replication protein A OB domain-containing protein n=1 Tax=Ramazzottius varieornatus TaxID=947166 RepID=A0A1D1VFU9_RAMVA|nr:hypothetical protein RvY_11339 [Ramazzottius varieornatus]
MLQRWTNEERYLTTLSELKNNLGSWNPETTIVRVVIDNNTPIHQGRCTPAASFDASNERCQVKITAFGAEAGRYHALLEVGKVYYLSNFKIKAQGENDADGLRYSASPFTIVVKNDTWVERDKVFEGYAERHSFFTYRTVGQIVKEAELEKLYDVIGKISCIEDLEIAGNGRLKLPMNFSDPTGSILLTLWEEMATTMEEKLENGKVLGIKDCAVKMYKGQKVLCTIPSSTVYDEPADHAGQLIKAMSVVAEQRPETPL